MKPGIHISLKLIKKTLKLVYQSSKKWSLINGLMTLVRGVVPLLLLFLVKELIDVTEAYLNDSENNSGTLYFVITITGLFFLVNAISGSLSNLFRERQRHYVNDYIQNIIHRKTVNIPFSYFENSNYQDIFYRALSEANYRPGRVFYGLLQISQSILTLCLIALVLSGLHWGMIPLLIISGVPVLYFRLKYTRLIYAHRKEHTEDERRVQYFNRLLTARDFAKELRIFNLGATFKGEYEKNKMELRDKQWALAKSKTFSELFVQVFSTVVLILVIAFVLSEAVSGKISIGAMAMYFLALQRIYAVLQTLLTGVSSLYEDVLFLRNFYEFEKIKLKDDQSEAIFPSQIYEGVELKNVSFTYPNTNKEVLKGINLKIPKGKTVALVGRNGSGKTSLVKLLCGLHRPDSGGVFIDNVPFDSIKQHEIAKNISVIFQDFMLYNVSAQNNIQFGNMQRQLTEEGVSEAAAKAGIDQLFRSYKSGYQTTLGTLFKGSQMMSQGEWQRTALARSFYNTDAQIIILDEPTSSLDAFTEAKLISHFKEIITNKTAVIVSHRLSTIKLADIVVVLAHGKVEEVGAPDELMSKKGYYYDMINSLS